MCPVLTCLFVMWPRESPPRSATTSHTEAISTLSEDGGEKSFFFFSFRTHWPKKQPKRNCFSQIIILIFLFYISIFLTACGGWKPSASSWSHCIPLAQTAPEIGPVFVRRSIAVMQPPPLLPSLSFSQANSGGLVGPWHGKKCLVIGLEGLFNLFEDTKHEVRSYIPQGFAFRVGGCPWMSRQWTS